MSETKLQIQEKAFSEKTPAEIVQSTQVKNKFVQVYQMMHGKSNGEAFYQREQFHFLKQLSEKPEVANCSKLSLYGSFMDAAVNDLSFDPGMKQVYLVPFGNKCTLMVSPYGELHMRIRSGQIKHADNPVLVYDGDHFEMGTRNGGLFVEHKASFPRKSDNIIACYVRLERPDGSVDYKVLSIDEINKLKAFSKQPNSIAWTKGLPGMIQAKTLKHAFKSYPRVRLRGSFVQVEEETEEVNFDYSLDGGPDVQSATPAAPAAISNGKIQPNVNANGNGISAHAKAATAAMTSDDDGGGVNHSGGDAGDDLFN